MKTKSKSHLVLIPSYNPGPKIRSTVLEALQYWNPVWVVIDGSNDGSYEVLKSLAVDEPGLKVISLPENGGKGTAVLS